MSVSLSPFYVIFLKGWSQKASDVEFYYSLILINSWENNHYYLLLFSYSIIYSINYLNNNTSSGAVLLNSPRLDFLNLHWTAWLSHALWQTALHFTALPSTGLYCMSLHCTGLHCAALHCTSLHWTALLHCCTTLHCTACTALHCAVILQSTAEFSPSICCILYCRK